MAGPTPADLVRRSAAYLERHGVESPTANAETLLMHILGTDRAGLYARREGLDTASARLFGRALCRRCAGTPLQHLTGEQQFLDRTLTVRPGVFVPRPETEVVAMAALDAIDGVTAPLVVDVGTGTGAIAVTIAGRRPDAVVSATDVSPDAVDLARGNARRLGVRVDVREGDLLSALDPAMRGRVDLIVSNPPYLTEAEYEDLPAEVRVDPYEALVGGTDVHARLADDAVEWLRPGGWLVVEIGDAQAAEVRALFERAGYVDVDVRPDLSGRDRVVVGRRSLDGAASDERDVVNAAATVDPLRPERSEAALAAAERALRDGGLVVLPTETVYGIACRPDDPSATSRLFDAKARPHGLNLAVLTATADEALTLVAANPFAGALAAALWPGPLTMVLRRSPRAAGWSLGEDGDTVGVRVPDLSIARALLARTGPLAVTSANRSGDPPAETPDELRAAFGDAVAVYLTVESGAAGSGEPSTVVDLTDPPRIRLLRAGGLTRERLAAALGASAPDPEWVDFPTWR